MLIAALRLSLFGLWLSSVAALGLAVWLRSPTLAAALFVVAVVTSPLGWRGRFGVSRLAVLFLVVALLIASAERPLHEVQARLDALAAQIDAHGTDGFSDVDKAAIATLGVAMIAGGYLAGYPEAAHEHLLLYTEGPKVRRFDSDFPMQSKRLPNAIAAAAHGGRVRVSFDSGDPLRLSLALNPLLVEVKRSADDLEVVGRVDVRYPIHSRVPLFTYRGVTLHMQEGLFWVLEESGWLHPYIAEWHWTVKRSGADHGVMSVAREPAAALNPVEAAQDARKALEDANQAHIQQLDGILQQ